MKNLTLIIWCGVRQDLRLFSVEKKVESHRENCLQRDQGWELIELYFRCSPRRGIFKKIKRECLKITGRCTLFLRLFKDAVSTVDVIKSKAVPATGCGIL